jgi:hypothetical protein
MSIFMLKHKEDSMWEEKIPADSQRKKVHSLYGICGVGRDLVFLMSLHGEVEP